MLTLEQLYNHGMSREIDIFSGLKLPLGSPINRTTLINSIMELCGLNIPMYADPEVMANAISLWSAKNQYTFEHVAKILTAEYSPIENKYYTEETDFNRGLSDNTKGNTTRTESVKADNKTTHKGSDITESTTSAYNSSDYEPNSKDTFTHGESVENGGNSKKDIGMGNTNDKTVKENTKTKSIQRGNIGITSNTELQLGEYDLLGKLNHYTFLAGLFENQLTIFVY